MIHQYKNPSKKPNNALRITFRKTMEKKRVSARHPKAKASGIPYIKPAMMKNGKTVAPSRKNAGAARIAVGPFATKSKIQVPTNPPMAAATEPIALAMAMFRRKIIYFLAERPRCATRASRVGSTGWFGFSFLESLAKRL